ncbi:hypothetical protein EC988_004069 [Linderina pennispora]|nr:hypothetical protein EC988_004069 [Linderina pennispora]
MEQWLFRKDDMQNTPSLTGSDYSTPVGKIITLEDERLRRNKGCGFIHNVVRRLELPQLVASTACVFFHRFFMRQSLADYQHLEVAGSCVFLATKVEEHKRNLKDVAYKCALVATKGNEAESVRSRDNWVKLLQRLEITVLENCCFDMQIVHPYEYISQLVIEMNISVDVAKAAMAHVNDCLRSVICLLYRPEVIAAAAVTFALAIRGERVPVEQLFHSPVLGLTAQDEQAVNMCLEDIAEFYSREADLAIEHMRQMSSRPGSGG